MTTTPTRRRRQIRRAGPPPADPNHDADVSLVETLDRVLARGVVAHAEVVLCVADIPLVYIGLQALVSSVETARVMHEVAGATTDGDR